MTKPPKTQAEIALANLLAALDRMHGKYSLSQNVRIAMAEARRALPPTMPPLLDPDDAAKEKP